MKQTKLLLISVFALGGLLSATSCGEEVTPTLYNVETSAGAGTTITLSGDKTSFQPGEMVTFTVALTSTDGSQELKTVMFGDTSLAIESDGTYEIAMPNEDVTITTTAGPVEVTDYAVTFNEGDGSTISLTTGDGATRFAPGAEVSFTVAVDDERITTLDSVTVDGKAVEAIDGTYTFTMPSKDVEIATTTTILGDGSLLNISDVAFEVKSIEDIQTLLTQSAEKEADYINGGRVVEDGVSSYEQSYDYTYSIGSDNKLSYEGTMTSYDSAVLSSYVYHEVGLYDATHYYEFNFNSTSGASVNAMSVVGDDATYSSGTIKESEAKQKVSMAGFSETAASYMRNIDTIEEQSTSDDNKYLTIVTSGENVSYAEYTKYDLSLVFDGDVTEKQLSRIPERTRSNLGNIILLPGGKRPEQVIYEYILSLGADHDFWSGTAQSLGLTWDYFNEHGPLSEDYKQVDERSKYKKWWNTICINKSKITRNNGTNTRKY